MVPVLVLAALAGWWASGVRATADSAGSWVSTAWDLRVYYAAAEALLRGGDIYAPVPDVFPYIYPPFAAIGALPLRLMDWPTATVMWAVFNSLLVVAVLHRLGVRTPWQLGLASVASVLWLPPVQSTLEFGQVGILLLFLVVFDLVEPADGRRLLPRGVLLGIAIGIKLTPAAFVVFLLLGRQRRAAINATLTFAATVLLGVLVTPRVAVHYWLRLAGGDSGADPVAEGLLGNFSMQSAIQRVVGADAGRLPGLALGLLLLALGLLAARLAERAGQLVLGLTVLGLTSALANPITWLHHLVWVLPGAVVLVQRRQPPLLRTGMLAVLVWLSIAPQLRLGGIDRSAYTAGDLWFAASSALAALFACLLVIAWGLVTLQLAASPADRATRAAAPPTLEPIAGDGQDPAVPTQASEEIRKEPAA